MLRLPIYLRFGSYYLHTRIGGKQFKRCLYTNDKAQAIIRAVKIFGALEMAKQPGELDLSSLLANEDRAKRFEIDLQRGVLKADGPEDHARMMEALALLKSTQEPQARDVVSATVNSPAEKGLRLLDLLDKFFLLKSHLKSATVTSYTGTIEEFKTFLKNPFLQTIGVSSVTRFQEHLAKKGNSPRTIDSKITTIGTLLNFAIKQGYYFDKNPAEGRALQTKKQRLKTGYLIATEDEVRTFYTSEQFKAWKTSNPEFYWALVLVLVTGCRISEITSLTAEQFKETASGIHYLSVVDAKTPAGVRDIPLPDYLFSTGLSDFLPSSGKAFTISDGAILHRFKRLLVVLKIERKLVVHSLRKFVNDYLSMNGVDFETRCQFIGHEFDHVNVSIYKNLITIEGLSKRVKPVQQKILVLSGLFQTKF